MLGCVVAPWPRLEFKTSSGVFCGSEFTFKRRAIIITHGNLRVKGESDCNRVDLLFVSRKCNAEKGVSNKHAFLLD